MNFDSIEASFYLKQMSRIFWDTHINFIIRKYKKHFLFKKK
jgi:hypothetical protein